jgi:acyl dehydratase
MTVVSGWGGRYFEDFVVGETIVHVGGRTISEADNTWLTLLTCNAHPCVSTPTTRREPSLNGRW